MRYRFHTDPGHGWLEVPVEVVRQVGVLDKVSEYSYYSPSRKVLFLEEDCDAPLLNRFLGIERADGSFDQEAYNQHIEEVVYRTEQAPLRGLPRFVGRIREEVLR